MNTGKKILVALLTATVTLAVYAAAKIIDEKTIVKTLESNTKETTVSAQIGIQQIDVDENENLLITMTRDAKGKNNPTLLASKKFVIQSAIDLTDINPRLQHADLPSYKVEFKLASKKPKIYSLTKLEGIESVAEYNNRLYNEEMDRQRFSNAKSGLGNITNAEVERQRAANEKSGQGKYTNAELDVQRTSNAKSGFGNITNAEVEKQRAANEKSGLGKITDQQVKTQKSANKESGFGEITDFQVDGQRENNEKSGLGKITDQQVKTQKAANKKSGFGELTDFQVDSQRDNNEKAGLGKITDEQVQKQKAANKSAGNGEFTDFQIASQKKKNKKDGLGEITDVQLAKLQENIKEGKAFEEKKQWVHALAYYYDKMEENPTADSAYILVAYNKIADAIMEGKPGPGEYDVFSLYEGWTSLCKEYESYWAKKDKIYGAVPSGLRKGNLDYSTKTGSYTLNFTWKYTKDTRKYKIFKDLLVTGYRKAYKSDWIEMDKNWPKYDDYTGGIKFEEAKFIVADKNGNNLIGTSVYAVKAGYTGNLVLNGVSPSSMTAIDSGNYQVKITGYGYMDWSSVDFEMVKIPGLNIRMMTTEVFQGLYESVMGENPSQHRGPGLPVEQLSWFDALVFCNKLSVQEGLTPVYAVNGNTNTAKWNYIPHRGNSIKGKLTLNTKANGYRLPTVEEWLYSSTEGHTKWESGEEDDDDEIGWHGKNSNNMTHPVGLRKANKYGLYDMGGNVEEWCWDTGGGMLGHYGDFRLLCDDSYLGGPGFYKYFDSDIHYASADRYSYTIGFRVVRYATK